MTGISTTVTARYGTDVSTLRKESGVKPIQTALAIVCICPALCATGCSSVDSVSLASIASLFDGESQQRMEEEHRSRFQASRSPDDLNWLLHHHIENGMTPSEVSRVIGEEGQRVYSDSWIKNSGGHYHAGDETWKWGPDRQGNSVYLVFRERRLVNFDPSEFLDSPFEE